MHVNIFIYIFLFRQRAGEPRVSAGLDPLVYARHGRELMGCKSPVREPRYHKYQPKARAEGRPTVRRKPKANVRADGQKLHTRLSPRASQHHMTKPTGSGGRVNAAVVHGKFTFLSGEICVPCHKIVMRESGMGQPGNQGPGVSAAVV